MVLSIRNVPLSSAKLKDAPGVSAGVRSAVDTQRSSSVTSAKPYFVPVTSKKAESPHNFTATLVKSDKMSIIVQNKCDPITTQIQKKTTYVHEAERGSRLRVLRAV
jgi:hypothetical protein